MSATRPNEELRALCYEHHGEMRLDLSLLSRERDAGQTLAYACAEPGCLVHYHVSRGYFMPSQDGNGNEPDMVPSVRCLHDGIPMYLAEIDLEKRAFRLWRCPQCDGRRTNEEGLIGLSSQEMQDVSGKSRVPKVAG